MRTGRALMIVVVVALLLLAAVSMGYAQDSATGSASVSPSIGTAFTYQGRLSDGGHPASGAYDFQFRLYTSASGGSQVGSTVTRSNVQVTDGFFTVSLDFGDAFTGSPRWLQVAVRHAGSGSYTTLSPRQELTPAPYALYSGSVPWSGLIGVPAGFTDNTDNDTTYTAGSGLSLSGTQFSLDTTYTDARYWKLGGNSTGADGVLGVTSNHALNIVVGNARALRLEPNSASPNVIGGYSGNSVTAGVVGVTIGGGGKSSTQNKVTDDYGTVGGGAGNQAGDGTGNTSSASYATVGGGLNNTASGYEATVGGGEHNAAIGGRATVGGGGGNSASDDGTTVGGGYKNTAGASFSTVGGGSSNTASGENATISGGTHNTTSSESTTIGGGSSNTASGKYATVSGGTYNIASGDGAFVGGGGYDGTHFNGNRAQAPASTIGGGVSNVITPTATYATIGGGWRNTAVGPRSTIGGGEQNSASDYLATIGGGFNNRAGFRATVGGGDDNTAIGSRSTIGGGSQNSASERYATIGGGSNNTASGPDATVGGGGNNTASKQYATVGGGVGNIASGDYANVGGGGGNTASGPEATVGGGGDNTASGSEATVGGGWYNTASGDYATVGGGKYNTASGDDATVGGGSNNTASGPEATVGGGSGNYASGYGSTVSGGAANSASGIYATIGGGSNNEAKGNYSFAAGYRAKANADGCFVWGDSHDYDVACSHTNRTIFRSSGGFYIYTSGNLISGAYLRPGGGSWYTLSDRNAKENIRPVDPMEVLDRLARMPVSTWNYKTQDDAIRHMGPMAQDFYAAFGLGDSDKAIATVDAEGVALAAIQGLYQQNQDQAKQIADLKAQNARLQAQIEAIESQIEALKAQCGGGGK